MSQAAGNLSRFSFLFLICLFAVPLFSNENKAREMGLQMRSIMLQEWEAGALSVADGFGCDHPVWQLRGESAEQAITIYARRYVTGDCLILLPIRGGHEYFFGYAGQFEGRITNDTPDKWPGTPVYYLRDNCIPERLPGG